MHLILFFGAYDNSLIGQFAQMKAAWKIKAYRSTKVALVMKLVTTDYVITRYICMHSVDELLDRQTERYDEYFNLYRNQCVMGEQYQSKIKN